MASSSSSLSSIVQILVKDQDGTYHVHRIKVSDGDPKESCVQNIRALFPEDTSVGPRLAKQLLSSIIMRKPVVGTVSSFQLDDPEIQLHHPKHVYEMKKNDAMTNILLDTSTPIPSTKELHEHLLKGIQNGNGGHTKVWCYYYEFSALAAAIWLLTALVVATIMGLAVGGATGDGKLGLGVGGGLLAVLMTIHMAISMCYKY